LFKPYAKGWAIYRQDKMPKVRKAQYVKKFEDELSKYNTDAIHIDIVDRKNLKQYKNTYVYSEGTPNFNHFHCRKNAEYVHISGLGWGDYLGTYNPFKYEYKNYDIDSNILKFYLSIDNNKFGIKRKTPEWSSLPEDFDLFVMQQPTTVDRNTTQNVLNYARNKKRHVIFSAHPSSNDKHDWNIFKKSGLVSKYTHFVNNIDTNELAKKCKRLISAYSGVSFVGLIYQKPTFNYRNTPWSEIIPVIKNATTEVNDKIPDEEELLRFLSWYYHKLTFDLNNSNWTNKLCKLLST
tara:strand:+ start:263 stop:1141 length:879 start_codon:yes stop_codon:yes gene_type:complete